MMDVVEIAFSIMVGWFVVMTFVLANIAFVMVIRAFQEDWHEAKANDRQSRTLEARD